MKPQRIASLLASATEILYGLGLGEKVVAVSHECDFPPEVASKPRVTYTHIAANASSVEIDRQVTQRVAAGKPIYNIDVETLASLRPDLIVTQAQCEVCAVSHDDVLRAVQDHDALKDTVVIALNATTLDEIFEDIKRVGDAAACPTEAQVYVTDLRKRVEVVQAKAASAAATHRPRVVCIEWIDPVMVAANWMPELIDLAGGQSELTSSGARSRYTASSLLDPAGSLSRFRLPRGINLSEKWRCNQLFAFVPKRWRVPLRSACDCQSVGTALQKFGCCHRGQRLG